MSVRVTEGRQTYVTGTCSPSLGPCWPRPPAPRCPRTPAAATQSARRRRSRPVFRGGGPARAPWPCWGRSCKTRSSLLLPSDCIESAVTDPQRSIWESRETEGRSGSDASAKEEDTWLEVKALKSVDLPTLGIPTIPQALTVLWRCHRIHSLG